VLDSARQAARAESLPSAHVTVTFYKAACVVGPIGKQETCTLGPGQFALYHWDRLSFDDKVGTGCLFVARDQPVVTFNGAVCDIAYSPASDEQSRAVVAITFRSVDWGAAAAP
jgi:hypothetical protein